MTGRRVVKKGRTADRSDPAPTERCQNCDAALAGRFCSSCGQRVEHEVHSLGYFFGEAIEDLSHADSRLWRTLVALVFKPGFLTREYFAGRRTRYLPPVRLYLVLSVLVFMASGRIFLDQPVAIVSVTDRGVTDVRRLGPGPMAHGLNCRYLSYSGPGASWIEPRLQSNCYKVAADNGLMLREQFLHHLPRALFLFLPLLALFMKAMYWRPSRHYVEHLLFFVHDHAAAFLVLSVYGLLRALTQAPLVGTLAGFAITVYLPVYLYRSMRVFYGQGRALTALKFATLSVAYLVSGALMMGLLMAVSYLAL